MTDEPTSPRFRQGDEVFTTALWTEQRVIVSTRVLSWHKPTGGALVYLLRLQSYTMGNREDWIYASYVHGSMDEAVEHVKVLAETTIEHARTTIERTVTHRDELVAAPDHFVRSIPIPEHVLERV